MSGLLSGCGGWVWRMGVADGSDGERAGVAGDLLAQAVTDDGAHRHQAGVGDRVVGGSALGASRHDPCVMEDSQMLGDVGLAGAQAVDQLADVLFTVVEQGANDPEARGVAQDSESFCDVFEQFGWEGLRHMQHSITIER